MRNTAWVMRSTLCIWQSPGMRSSAAVTHRGESTKGAELFRVLQRTDPKICSRQASGSGDPLMQFSQKVQQAGDLGRPFQRQEKHQ